MVCLLPDNRQAYGYLSFLTVFALLAITAPAALPLAGQWRHGRTSHPLRGWAAYISVVRGVPDIAFFLFL